MKKISIGKYAKLHKISRAQVIKQIVSGKLKSQEIEEDGRKKTYILLEDEEDYDKHNNSDFLKEFIEKNMKNIKILWIFKESEGSFILVYEKERVEALKIVKKQDEVDIFNLKRVDYEFL